MTGTKVTFFFQERNYGWTESYFLPPQGGSPPGPSTGFLVERARAANLAYVRSLMLYAGASLISARFSDLAGGRLAFTDSSPPNYPRAGTVSSADFSDTAIIGQLLGAGATKQGRRFFRGNADDAVTDAGLINSASSWYTTYFPAFKAKLLDPALQWSFTAKNTGASWTSVVTGVTQNTDGTARIHISGNNFPLTSSERIEVFISGVQGANTINGLNLVQGVDLADPTKADTVRKVAILPFTNQGKISYRAIDMFKIEEVNLVRVGERKAGRPSPVVPGRRPARVRG